jgi:hypothetical protein
MRFTIAAARRAVAQRQAFAAPRMVMRGMAGSSVHGEDPEVGHSITRLLVERTSMRKEQGKRGLGSRIDCSEKGKMRLGERRREKAEKECYISALPKGSDKTRIRVLTVQRIAREKARNLKGEQHSSAPHKEHAPGWNEHLAVGLCFPLPPYLPTSL